MEKRTSVFEDIFNVEARRFYLLVACFLFTSILLGNNSIIGKVGSVFDGDTNELRSSGKNHRVRLDGINIFILSINRSMYIENTRKTLMGSELWINNNKP